MMVNLSELRRLQKVYHETTRCREKDPKLQGKTPIQNAHRFRAYAPCGPRRRVCIRPLLAAGFRSGGCAGLAMRVGPRCRPSRTSCSSLSGRPAGATSRAGRGRGQKRSTRTAFMYAVDAHDFARARDGEGGARSNSKQLFQHAGCCTIALACTPGAVFVPASARLALPHEGARCEELIRGRVLQMHSGDKVGRRASLALAAFGMMGLRSKPAVAMTEAEEIAKLQKEASRIQEIIDVQKEAVQALPSLKDSIKAAKSSSATASTTKDGEPAVLAQDADVSKVVTELMASLQKDGDKGMELVLANSAPGNPYASMGYEKVCNFMRQTKLAMLLEHFSEFKVLSPKDIGKDERDGAPKVAVDVLVKAPYQQMLQNGMQFSDMIMGNEKDMLCTATYRWVMKKDAEGKWRNMGCRVIDPITA